jgi:hypothetical protein
VRVGAKFFGIRRQTQSWSECKAIAPLWAGILVEAKPWNRHALIDVHSIEKLILEAVCNDARRLRAFEGAKWFAQQATTYAHKQDSDDQLIAPQEIVRLPEFVRTPEKLTLVPLPERALEEARKYRTKPRS